MSWPGTSKPVFLPIHASFTAGYACFPVIYYQNTNVTTVVHGGQQVVSVSERITRLQANPTRAVALSKARQRVGKWLVDEKFAQKGLAALRMQAGLSQKGLADRLGTQQSNVSRWEKAPGDMQFSSIKSLAMALNVTVDVVCQAISASTDAVVA